MSKNYGSLFIISTPIGNLDDITLRAIEILNKVDICACEDTRTSKILFDKYSIRTKLTSYHKFSEKVKTQYLIRILKEGKSVALISDAGTPMISDPGKFLVEEAIENGITISPIPGVTSVIAALTVSGFNIQNFTFYGFFPRKNKDQNLLMDKIKNSKNVSVFFESGKRLEKLFDIFSNFLAPDQRVFVAREMTKIHETFYRGQVNSIKKFVTNATHGKKGEFVVVVDGCGDTIHTEVTQDDIRIMKILTDDLESKLALKIGSKILNKSRNQIYKLTLKD